LISSIQVSQALKSVKHSSQSSTQVSQALKSIKHSSQSSTQVSQALKSVKSVKQSSHCVHEYSWSHNPHIHITLTLTYHGCLHVEPRPLSLNERGVIGLDYSDKSGNRTACITIGLLVAYTTVLKGVSRDRPKES